MRTLVVGTGNKHKAEEICAMLEDLPIKIRIAGSYGPFDPEESGSTLEANAVIKAMAAMDLSGEWSVSDDTGLFISAIDGRPGVYAARYAGPDCNWKNNIDKILKELEGIPPNMRFAKFGCVIAFCRPARNLFGLRLPFLSKRPPSELFRGEYDGFITTERRGAIEFGYDQIFLMKDRDKTFAEIDKAEKNALSHRAKAVLKFKERLKKLL